MYSHIHSVLVATDSPGDILPVHHGDIILAVATHKDTNGRGYTVYTANKAIGISSKCEANNSPCDKHKTSNHNKPVGNISVRNQL